MDKRRTNCHAVDAKDINAILNSPTGTNTLVDLSLDGELTTVIMKELTRDILVSIGIFMLIFPISSQKDLNFPLLFLSVTQPALKKADLQQSLREVTLKCLPTKYSEQIKLDVRTANG